MRLNSLDKALMYASLPGAGVSLIGVFKKVDGERVCGIRWVVFTEDSRKETLQKFLEYEKAHSVILWGIFTPEEARQYSDSKQWEKEETLVKSKKELSRWLKEVN